MLDSICFYTSDTNDIFCYAKIGDRVNRIFTKNKREIINIINKYNIKPSTKNIDYLEYTLNDFRYVKHKDLERLINLAKKEIKEVKVNREKSMAIKKQIIGITSSVMLASFLASSLTINEKVNKSMKNKTFVEVENIPIDDHKIDEIENIKDILNKDLNDYTDLTIQYIKENEESKNFNFKYDDNSNDQRVTNSYNYMDLYNKYGQMYGIDPNVLMAIGAQENRGIHQNYIEGNPAVGLMQIEIAVWNNETVRAFNFNTNSWEKVTVELDKLNNVDYNIKIASMIFQTKLRENKYNIPISLQAYNMGYGNINKILEACSKDTGISIDSILNHPSNNTWLNYTNVANGGNKLYAQGVLSFLENGSTLHFKNINGNDEYININNENVNNYSIL